MIAKDKICAVVAARDAQSMLRQVASALRFTSTVELRLDWLADDHQIERFLRHLALKRSSTVGKTLIATCRRRVAGGKYRGSIAKQILHLAGALQAGCSWYDLEVESIRECPPELLDVLAGEGKRLASAHFFRRVPRNLRRIAEELEQHSNSDASKIAVQCSSLSDGLRVLKLARVRRDVVAIPMGDAALPLRVLALREGSAISYGPVANSTAPGQVSLAQMKELYRADRLDRLTCVYGIVGDPVAHSLSPIMQNAAFQMHRMNAVYLPFLVRDLPDFLGAIKPVGIAGFSVTIPHKQSILRHLDGCDPLAGAIGAVNTVVVRAGHKLYGYNTDYVGVLRALEPRIPLRGSRVLIVGAGGAARAVAFALAQAGAAVCISSRRPKRAATLAKAVQGATVPRKQLRREFFDAIVNATPVGMHPRVQDSPLDSRDLNCRLVFDTIYRPRTTKLLRLAANRGIETVSGVEMFIAQGTAQWEIWTGQRAPVDVMRRAVVKALDREERIHSPK